PSLRRQDADHAAVRAVILKPDAAGDSGENRIVLAQSGVEARPEAAAPLAHDDGAAGDQIAVVRLDTQALRVRVAAVARAALSFFMSHMFFDWGSRFLVPCSRSVPWFLGSLVPWFSGSGNNGNQGNSISNDDFGDSDARVDGAVAARLPLAFAPLFLEHADLWPTRLAVDNGDDTRIGDEGGADENLAAILFDQQHVFDRQLIPRRAHRP